MGKRIVASIDVGTTKVCTTIADISEVGIPQIVGVGIAPSVGLHGSAAELAGRLGVAGWHVSLTHTATLAQAVAVAHG